MKGLYYGFLNEMLRLSCRGEANRWRQGMKFATGVQREKLRSILKKNQNCVYGRRYSFADCNDPEAFRRSVPLTIYEDYLPYLERIKRGESRILTEEPVLLFEPTSGSASASKLIPYTAGLKAEFQCGIQPWIYDLYTHYPKLKDGRSYWSITPLVQKKYTVGKIGIGFEEDTAYFGKVKQLIMERLFILSKTIAKETDMDQFYFKTCLALLRAKDLSLISVWNPSYLFLLLDYIRTQQDKLLQHINKRRREEVCDCISMGNYSRLWPNLAVISCWCDGAAGQYEPRLAELFPQTFIQPKGLLATEGFITFPLVGKIGASFSIFSHYFEFRSLADGSFAEIDELRMGIPYEVIITTSGGLYRYCLRDSIEVVEYDDETGMPLVRFIGKADKVSDLYGEKLHEWFVQKVMERFVPGNTFYLVAPEQDRYVLFVCADLLPSVGTVIDDALRENFHYDYCRKLGQLQCLKIFRLTGNPAEDYLRERTRRGMRLGDIKAAALALDGGWDKVFKGRYIEK